MRAGIVSLEQLALFRWSSYRHFVRGTEGRPAALTCEAWLAALGGLTDSPAGWRSYHDHLAWLMADAGRQKEAAFERMSRGWAHGSEGFRAALAKDFKEKTAARDWGGEELAEINRLDWSRRLTAGLQALDRNAADAASAPKSAPWKVAVAAWMKRQCSVPNRWLGEQLHMGPPDAVSRYVSEVARGDREEAAGLLEALTTKVRG